MSDVTDPKKNVVDSKTNNRDTIKDHELGRKSEFVTFHSPNPNVDYPGNSLDEHRQLEKANTWLAEKEFGQQNENNART